MVCWTTHLKCLPQKRQGYATVMVGPKIYSFVRNRDINNKDQMEVHVFNTVSLRWKKLLPPTTGKGESPLKDTPRSFWGHTAVLMEDHMVYIWGGLYTLSREYGNVLYVFDVHTHSWFKPKVTGTVPKVRSQHSACALGKVMYLHGGFNTLTCFDDKIQKLDTTTMVWTLIGGTLPPASAWHFATFIGTKIRGQCIPMLVFMKL